MRILPESYIKEFYSELPEKYKELGFQHIKDMCYAPFRFLRKQIQSNYLPVIRFKYFGIFRPSEKKANFELKKYEYRYAKGYISEEEYFRVKNMVDNCRKVKGGEE